MGQAMDIYGIVTNGEGWKFYHLALGGEVSESLLHGIGFPHPAPVANPSSTPPPTNPSAFSSTFLVATLTHP